MLSSDKPIDDRNPKGLTKVTPEVKVPEWKPYSR